MPCWGCSTLVKQNLVLELESYNGEKQENSSGRADRGPPLKVRLQSWFDRWPWPVNSFLLLQKSQRPSLISHRTWFIGSLGNSLRPPGWSVRLQPAPPAASYASFGDLRLWLVCFPEMVILHLARPGL